MAHLFSRHTSSLGHKSATDLPNDTTSIGTTLWLHITLMLAATILLCPLILILEKRKHRWLSTFQVITLLTLLLGTGTASFQTHQFHSTPHSVLGYTTALLSSTYLGYNLFTKPSQSPAFTEPSSAIPNVPELLRIVASFTFSLLLYLEIILGFLSMYVSLQSPLRFESYLHKQPTFLLRSIHAAMFRPPRNRFSLPPLLLLLGRTHHHPSLFLQKPEVRSFRCLLISALRARLDL
jgi:hypothetical protein